MDQSCLIPLKQHSHVEAWKTFYRHDPAIPVTHEHVHPTAFCGAQLFIYLRTVQVPEDPLRGRNYGSRLFEKVDDRPTITLSFRPFVLGLVPL
jgi:hypothetical protein